MAIKRTILAIAALALLFIAAVPAFAQITTVSGTVVDVNGNAYFPGTVSASVSLGAGQALPAGVPASGSIGPFPTTVGGNFSVTVQSPLTWVFTICGAPKNIGPLANGTPTQVCFPTGPIAISGVGQSLTTLLTSIPLLGPGGTSGGGSSGDRTISPLSFGALWDVKAVPDCSWAVGTSTVTCPDGNFTAADIGKIMFGVRGTSQVTINVLTSALDFAQGTITGLVSSTAVTVSTVAGATCPDGNHANCNFAWGTQDDTAAIQAAEDVAWNTPGVCKALKLPSGFAFIKLDNGLFNGPVTPACATASGSSGFSDVVSVGPEMYGQGQQVSKMIILPSSVFTGCVFGSSLTTCMGAAPNLQAHDFGIDGLQNPVGGSHNNILWESIGADSGGTCDGGATAWNMALSNYAFSAFNSTGIRIGVRSCNDPMYYNINVTLFGSNTCNFQPRNALDIYGMLCFGGVQGAVLVTTPLNDGAPHLLNLFGGSYYTALGLGAAVFGTTGSSPFIINIFGGHILDANIIPGATQAFALIRLDAPTTLYLHGTSMALPLVDSGGTSIILFSNNGGSKTYFDHSTVDATGTNNQLFNIGAADSIFDDGGNTFINGPVANVITGKAFGFTRSASGTGCATGNFALTSGWGTSSVASVAANGNILGCHVTVTGAAGGAGPVLTWTYPAAPVIAPASCHLSGPSGTLTGVSSGTPGATTVAYTFTGTPSAQTYNFDVGCP